LPKNLDANLTQKSDSAMKKVVIQPGCITCGACEFIAPEVFEVTDKAYVKENSDPEHYAQQIAQAVEACPVQVITIEQHDS